MASPNLNMRDPTLYRIRRATHHRTGDAWCIYPMYDYAHPLSDAIEGITHSLCTLEFEDHRPLYDWCVENLIEGDRPRQIEFARLNINYTVLSKRKLLQLVQQGLVSGCDGPRMPTLSGLRRRGCTPESIRDFAKRECGTREQRDALTDNGRDMLGDDVPPDELNRAPRAGMNFGFPYCHAGRIADPEFGRKHACSEFTPPARELGPHVAALGMRFYTGTMFPETYRNQIFIAEHGSWNRSTPIGYRVSLVRLQGDKAVSYEPFAQGWLQGSEAWGRPVDVQVMPDGALLVSDDRAGAIYRITYGKK